MSSRVIHFVDDQPQSPPADWRDQDWPRPSLEDHRDEREILAIILREYRRAEDIEAKLALHKACMRAKNARG